LTFDCGLEEDTGSKRLKIMSEYELANPQRGLMTSQRNAAGSRCIQQLTIAFDGGADIRVTDCAGHYEVHLPPEEKLEIFSQSEIISERGTTGELYEKIQVACRREIFAGGGAKYL
jgi:hypothetical protein